MWPALYSVLTPVCLEISKGLSILHSTSDILGITESDEGLQIILYGDRDLAGEIVFEGENAGKIESTKLDGTPIVLVRKDGRFVINYNHNHKKEQILLLKLR